MRGCDHLHRGDGNAFALTMKEVFMKRTRNTNKDWRGMLWLSVLDMLITHYTYLSVLKQVPSGIYVCWLPCILERH
jgi:hypothetical protein